MTSWGIAERTPGARRAGGIVGHPRLCYVVAFSPNRRRVLAAAAGRGVPVAVAATVAAMVSPVTVVSERTSDRASVRRGPSPPAWGLGCGRPNYWGLRKGRDPAVAGVPGREAVAVKPLFLRLAAPFFRAPQLARGREGHSGHVTRKRDFVDLRASGARVGGVAAGD